jgi:Tol biopolymer transport system component
VAAGAPEKLSASTRAEEVPQYSPDGAKIVFTSSRSGPPEVWVCERDGSNPLQLTFLGAPVTGSPHWSPDGKHIVFDSNVDGQFDIYAINAAGGSPQRLTSHAGSNALASFSRDNLHIYFSSDRSGRWELWKMPFAGGEGTRITTGGGRAPIESADGKLIYYERAYELWSVPVNGGQETKLLGSVGFLNFAVAQKGIYFLRDEDVDPRHTIEFFVPATRSTARVFEIGNAIGAGLAVAPDNDALLFTNVVQRGSDLMLVENFR